MNQGERAPAQRRDSAELLAKMDSDLVTAISEVDPSLIQLALERSPFERLRAGMAMARFAARFRRGTSEGR